MMSTEAGVQNSKCYQQMRGAGLSYTDAFFFQNAKNLVTFSPPVHTEIMTMIMKTQIDNPWLIDLKMQLCNPGLSHNLCSMIVEKFSIFESLNLILVTSSNKDHMSCCYTMTTFKNVCLYDTEIIYDLMLEEYMKLGKCKLDRPHK